MNNISYKSYINLYESINFSKCVNKAIYDLKRHNKKILLINQIGSSVQGIPILSVSLGCGSTKILINATHHAREAINTILVLDQIKYILNLYKMNLSIDGMSIRKLLNYVTFVFVPLVNPDGADLVLNGICSVSNHYKNMSHLQEKYFSSWKSNIRGVDLNRNYPTKYPSDDMINFPGVKGYPGPYSFSEPETYALKCLTEKYLFDGTISYHSSGEEIYWEYNQDEIERCRDLEIVNKISKVTGYNLIEEERPNIGSGYKDWFVENYKKPGLTIEVSPYVGERKVPIRYYKRIFEQNKNVPILFAKEVFYKVI